MHLVVCTVHHVQLALPSPHVMKVVAMDQFVPDPFCLAPFVGWVAHEKELRPVVDGGLLLSEGQLKHTSNSRILLVNSGKTQIGLLADKVVTRVGAAHMESEAPSIQIAHALKHLVDKAICVDDEIIHMVGSHRFQKAVQESFFK